MLSLATSLVFGSALLGTVSSSVIEARDCTVKNYGPFRLYVAPTDGGDPKPVKLVDLYTPRPTNDTISVLSVCPADDCGRQPDYWNLVDQVLTPTFLDEQVDFKTVNQDLSSSDVQVRFVTSDLASIAHQLHPIYCAVRNPDGTDGLPGFLSVAGSADDFSMCTNGLTVGSSARADIWYKPDMTTGFIKFCQPVHLMMQSTGIIADPIPE